MLKKYKEFLKRHDKLYVLCKCIQNINNPVLTKIIRGYYDRNYSSTSIMLMEHYGELMLDRIIFDIPRGEETVTRIGFYADMHNLLYGLKFAEMINAVPRVKWGENMPYYDHGMDKISSFYQDMFDNSYAVSDENIKLLSETYKKYIHLNRKTNQFIYGEINNLFGVAGQRNNAKILGIHVRGTDFNLGLLNHPNVVSPAEYLKKAREIFSGRKYNRIFLATEDISVIDMFVSEFGENILYYNDVFRTSGKSGPHSTPNGRELNNYKLGLEVLRDVYTLAHCDGFVSGLSHVAFAARYTNLALNRSFDDVYTIDNGIKRE